MKAKLTIISAAVTTKKFLFGMCNCTVGSGVGTGDFFARTGDLARVWSRSHVSPDMD